MASEAAVGVVEAIQGEEVGVHLEVLRAEAEVELEEAADRKVKTLHVNLTNFNTLSLRCRGKGHY